MNIKLPTTLLLGLLTIYSCTVNKKIQLNESDLRIVNRELIPSNTKGEIILGSKEGSGLAMINNVEFENGTIELEIKGENKPGQSFVGFAFNIQNDNTYEAIYFRPFNFLSPEKIRREHAIQYIHPPNNEWRPLRENHPGVYEAEFFSPPNPEEWFKVKLDISPSTVQVFDGRNGKLLLSVERLSKQQSNKIGFWIGHMSVGSYRNLKISN